MAEWTDISVGIGGNRDQWPRAIEDDVYLIQGHYNQAPDDPSNIWRPHNPLLFHLYQRPAFWRKRAGNPELIEFILKMT